MIRTPYEAGGFAFPNEAMMEKAIREEEGIRYIKESADLNNSQIIYEVYCQMVRQKIFETPVGYTFLHELQESLKADSSISLRDIPAVPVRAFKTEPSGEKREKPKEAGKVKTKVVYKKAVKNVDYKPWFRTSVTIIIILLGIVIGMFAVTATSGNINIVNYENALIEKYENWETQLLEREERLKERENALR